MASPPIIYFILQMLINDWSITLYDVTPVKRISRMYVFVFQLKILCHVCKYSAIDLFY
jgi:hypothetical protein